MGYIVRSECGDLREFLDVLVTKGSLVLLPDNTLDPQEFTDLLNLYELGLDETECIALAKQHGLSVCTDDEAARRAAAQHLGDDRVLGSLRLIRECVCQGLVSVQAAHVAYETMKARGAFLPSVSAVWCHPSRARRSSISANGRSGEILTPGRPALVASPNACCGQNNRLQLPTEKLEVAPNCTQTMLLSTFA
jgi:predicted nucleic acid-binding protein